MDPEAVLNEIRSNAEAIRVEIDENPAEDFEDMDKADLVSIAQTANDLINAFAGLDAWLTRQGFLPASWAVGRKTP